jgi:molybdate/tungstate transport system substrate-binding protein
MKWKRCHLAAGLAAACAFGFPATAAGNDGPVTLTVFGAGTLAKPFQQLGQEFTKLHPNVTVQSQFGGSVKMVKQVSELGQVADVVAVADYRVIPKFLFGGQGATVFADWYAGFATNSVTFVYTPTSKYAGEITADNWYKVLARPDVEIGRSNPDTDPSGYQTVQMLALAEQFYKQPGLRDAILARAPRTNMRDTETELIGALESGQIDYLAIYLSDARQHHFNYLALPPQINLSDARYAKEYAQATVKTANGEVTGVPTVYAITVPTNAAHKDWAASFVSFVLGKAGQEAMAAAGFGTVQPAYAFNAGQVPAEVKPLVTAWPQP